MPAAVEVISAGNLRNQAVADGQQREALQRFADGHALLHDADGETAQHVDQRDENGGNGVAAHEFAGAVHRAVKIRFLLDLAAARAGLGFVDHAGVQVRRRWPFVCRAWRPR